MEHAIDISEEQARLAFHGHVVAKAQAARDAYGPEIDADAMRRLLADPAVVRYPVTLRFDEAGLEAHELGFAQPLGFHPSDGYCLFVHPRFADRPRDWIAIAAYSIPTVNYGAIVDTEAAELYGSTLLGLETEDYYARLCELADEAQRAERWEQR